jgi:LuxR family maltose regulon positive regulatory protein
MRWSVNAMSSPLLRTKLYIPPPRRYLVRRPHLIQRLEEGQRLGRQLALLSSPTGFGKTTLLSEWIHAAGADGQAPPKVAWLTLDEDDNDPVRFLAYLVAAVQTVSADLGQMVQDLLGAPQLPPLPSMMTLLINDMAAAPHSITLVLDDYHLVRADQVHDALAFLLDHQPPNVHLVVSTRVDPPLLLPRLRVRGQMTEIRAEDLRFTAEEAAAFLRQALGLELDPELIAGLEARTEGWIAGLQLAALSMQGKSPAGMARFVAAFRGSHRHVIDYLAEEVLAQQPDDVRQFLRKTAILDRLSAPLCAAVTGREDSDALLKHLEEVNLFLVPLDDRREWYRYHRLFADFLSTDLDEEMRAALHLRAARWLAGHDLLPEAVKHALASGDMDEAAHTIALAAEGALRSASVATLAGWLDALPGEVVQADGDLAIYQGFTLLLAGQGSRAATFAAAAEGHLASEAPSASRGRLDSLRAHIALFDNDFESTIRFAQSALDHLGEGDDVFRDLALNMLGQALELNGDLAAAAEVYREAAQTGHQTGNQVGAMVVLTNLVFALNELGRRREAVALCQRIAEEGEVQAGRGVPRAEGIRLAWSLLSLEANELQLARDQVQRPLEICDRLNMVEGRIWGRYILAQVYLAQGDLEAMRRTIREGQKHTLGLDLYPGKWAWFAALDAQASLQEGNLAAAGHWAAAAGLTPADTPRHWDELPYFVYVRLLMAQNRLEEADTLLATLERSARQAGRLRKLITVYLQQALIRQAQHRTQAALACAERAVHLAAPEGYSRAFLDEGPGIAKLLLHIRHAAPDFVASLLEAFRREMGKTKDRRPATLSPPTDHAKGLIEPLTEREIEILRLIAAGRSNPEIADSLYLSLNTVKWHVKNLYGKLQVGNRVEAAARADELGLLQT